MFTIPTSPVANIASFPTGFQPNKLLPGSTSGLGLSSATGSLIGNLPNCNCGWSSSLQAEHTLMPVGFWFTTCQSSFASGKRKLQRSQNPKARLPKANLCVISGYNSKEQRSLGTVPDPPQPPMQTAAHTQPVAFEPGP